MDTSYLYVENLAAEVEIPSNGITSRTIYADDHVKVIIFGFDMGQELSKHTASSSAMIHILKGDATLTLGGEQLEAGAGSWAHMPAHLEHAVFARTPIVMLLILQL